MEITIKNQRTEDDMDLESPRFKRQKLSGPPNIIEMTLPLVRHDSGVESDTPVLPASECVQHEGVRSSDEGYEAHLWNDSWIFDIVFAGPNENHMLNCSKEFTSLIDESKPMGDLDNEILPLFARENWLLDGYVGNPDLVWGKLKPALQMASLLLTVPQVAWAYLPITQGTLTGWEGDGQFLSHDEAEMLRRHAEDPTFLVKHFEDLRAKFASLSGKVKFTFATFGKINRWQAADSEIDFKLPEDYDWEAESTGQVHGLTFNPGEPYLSDVFVKGDPLELAACQNLYRTFIHGAYAEFLQQDSSTVTPVQTIRTAFSLSVTLVHELCHALYCLERHPEIPACAVHKEYDEPHLFQDTECAEIGSAMERRLFGKPWQATIHPQEGTYMEAVHVPCAWLDGQLIHGRAHFVDFIEPNWCYAFFTQRKWDEIRSMPLAESARCCHLPTSARAYARTKKPDILRWFEARKKGKNLARMKPFDRNPEQGWELVIRPGNWNADGSWDPGYGDEEWAEAVKAVETLDRDFLEWKVKLAKKARKSDR